MISEAARFWRQVDVLDMRSCWEWKGIKRGDYGCFESDDRQEGAHRFAWSFAYGAIPTGMYVLHACDSPTCVNPRHLRIGTHEDNNADKSVLTRVRASLDQAVIDEKRAARAVSSAISSIVPIEVGAGLGPTALHANILRFRKMRGLTQSQVADALGTTKSAVCHWEKGVSAPTQRKFPALAALFGVAVDDLFVVHETNLGISPTSVTTATASSNVAHAVLEAS